jgi:hypothetical protein
MTDFNLDSPIFDTQGEPFALEVALGGVPGHTPAIGFGSGADADRITADGVVIGPHLTGPPGPAGVGVSDHGALTGLGDDDHSQYHTDARGDARYEPKSAAIQTHIASTANPHGVTAAQTGAYTSAQTDTLLAGKAAASHGHTSTAISDFAEAVDDQVAALLTAGANITLTYDDAANKLTIAATGGGGGSGDATSLQSRAVSTTAPTDKQVLGWDATVNAWRPMTISGDHPYTPPAGNVIEF